MMPGTWEDIQKFLEYSEMLELAEPALTGMGFAAQIWKLLLSPVQFALPHAAGEI